MDFGLILDRFLEAALGTDAMYFAVAAVGILVAAFVPKRGRYLTQLVLSLAGPVARPEVSAHLTLDRLIAAGGSVQKIAAEIAAADTPVDLPDADARALRDQGVAEIFGPGSSLKAIGAWLEEALDARETD